MDPFAERRFLRPFLRVVVDGFDLWKELVRRLYGEGQDSPHDDFPVLFPTFNLTAGVSVNDSFLGGELHHIARRNNVLQVVRYHPNTESHLLYRPPETLPPGDLPQRVLAIRRACLATVSGFQIVGRIPEKNDLLSTVRAFYDEPNPLSAGRARSVLCVDEETLNTSGDFVAFQAGVRLLAASRAVTDVLFDVRCSAALEVLVSLADQHPDLLGRIGTGFVSPLTREGVNLLWQYAPILSALCPTLSLSSPVNEPVDHLSAELVQGIREFVMRFHPDLLSYPVTAPTRRPVLV
jgi:hypothetical protein